MKYLVFIFLLILCSCNNKEPKKVDPEQFKEPLIGANRKMVKRESDDIDAYIRRRDLNMQKSGTGLRYMIIKEGDGEHPKHGNEVKVHYKVSLLDGTLCYNSEGNEPEVFVVEKDHVESGLHEGIKLMKKGGKAKFILPSHLAHGLAGDQDKIPPLASVIYDIELIDIK
jgi:FKBP-type peptidyl-prolyl cis-trans isomerase FkpA